jgi:hypothetical protein
MTDGTLPERLTATGFEPLNLLNGLNDSNLLAAILHVEVEYSPCPVTDDSRQTRCLIERLSIEPLA